MKYNGGSSIKNTTNSSFNTSSNTNEKLRKLNEELDQLEVAVASLTTGVSSVNAKVGTDDVAHQIEIAKTEINNAIGESVETAELSAADATITNANVDTLTVDTIDTTGDRIDILSNIETGNIYQRYSTIVPSDKAFIVHPNSIVRISFSNKYAIVFNSSQGNSIIITNVSDKIRYFVSGSSLYINVTEEASISCIGQTPTITNLQDTDFVFVKSGTNVLGPLYADLAQANLQNITITNTLSAKTISAENVNISEDLTVSGTVHADIDSDNIQADEIEVKDIDADRLNTSQIHTKVEKENLGYTTIPAHQSTELYAISVPVTNGLWEIELENSLRATLNKTNSAVEITYWRSSEDSLPLIGIKDDKLFIYTRDAGKVYFSNNTLENVDTTVEIYAPTSPNYPVVEDLDEKFEIATNDGVVNTSTTYVKDLVITGSCKYDGESEINVDILSVDDKIIAQGVCGLENQVLTTDCEGKTVWAYGLSSVNDTECSCDSDKVITKKALTDYNGTILDDVYKYPITNLGNNTCVHGNFSARREIYGGSAGNYTSCEVNNKSITTIKSTSSGGQWATQYCDINSVRTDVDNSIIKSEYCSFYGPSASTSRLCGSEVKTTKDNVVIASGTNASNCKCIILNKDMACIKAPLQVTGDTNISGTITANCFCGNATSANNATCFNGCTYSEACTDIRNGLATQTCADAIQNCANFIQSCVSAIEEKIPAQASASNQLADKDFVNSSIATNTANFRGTYACVAELPSTGNTNNDYAFVCSLNTATGNYIYDRYKWIASASCWVCEYELNTTGFTAEQLASINSGITSNLVAKITDVYDNTVTVCMNGASKGSFNLNQNTDATIDLGCEICNAKCFNGCTYADAKADIRAGLLATDAAANLCPNRILSWDATNSMAKTMGTSCACNLDVINSARICGRLEVGSVGKGRLCVGNDYVCLKDCSGDSIVCVSDTHVCMRTPSNYIDLQDNGKITFRENGGCLYQFCNEHIKYSCDNGSTWNNVVTQAETICTVCNPSGDAYKSPLSWGENDYLYYIPAISMSNCDGTIRMSDFYNGNVYYTYLAHSRDKLYIGNNSRNPSSYFYPNTNCSDGTMIWHGDVDGTVSHVSEAITATCLVSDSNVIIKSDCGNELNFYPASGNTMYLNYRSGVSTVIVSAGDCSNNLGTVCAATFCGNLCGMSEKIKLNTTCTCQDYSMPIVTNCCVFYSNCCAITFNPNTGRLKVCGPVQAAGSVCAATFCGNLVGKFCCSCWLDDNFTGNADVNVALSNGGINTVNIHGVSSACTLTFNPATGYLKASGKVWATSGFTSDNTATVKVECGNELNIRPATTERTWINYRGGANKLFIGDGSGTGCYGTVIASKFCGCFCGINFNDVANAYEESVNAGYFCRKVYSMNIKTGIGYRNRVAIGHCRPANSSWGTAYISVGLDDAGNCWRDYGFDEYGYITSPTGYKTSTGFTLTSNATCPISLTSEYYKIQLTSDDSTLVGYDTMAGQGATAIGVCTAAIGTCATAVGCEARACGDGSVAMGSDAHAEATDSTALGSYTEASGKCSTAVGYSAHACTCAIAIGDTACANSTSSVAVGTLANACGDCSVAVGYSAHACTCAIAIGCGAIATTNDSIAIGTGACTYAYSYGDAVDCHVVHAKGASAHFCWSCSVSQNMVFGALACRGKTKSPMWPLGCGCTYCGLHMVPARWIWRKGTCSDAGNWLSWDGDGNIDLVGTVRGTDHAICGTCTSALGARLEIWADWSLNYCNCF